MIRYLAAGGLVAAGLAGLLVLQYTWLLDSLRMERRRLDERVETVLLRTAQAIEGADSTRLLQLNKLVFRDRPSPERSAIQVESWLDSLLRSQVESVGGEPLPYAYQLLSENSGNAVLGSGDFDDRQLYANYARRLRGPRIIGYCRCELSLLLQVPDPMKVLLGRLRLQLTAAAAALICLLAGAGLLFFYLNRLRRLHAAKDDFLNHLVHELKTPLFSSRLLLRLLETDLQKQRDPAELRQRITALRADNERLRERAERVLDLAELDRPRLQLHVRHFSVDELLQKEFGTFGRKVAAAGGTYTTEITPGLYLESDATHFAGVVGNLLDNALKYQPTAPRIKLTVTATGRNLQLSVDDAAPRIPKKRRRRVFRRFYRLPGQTISGYGLGLHYVRTAVRAAGGRARIEDSPLGGNRFVVTYPHASPPRLPPGPPVSPPAPRRGEITI
ncbi:MAG: HAMP domain-containing sensor histidine kinase [Saprospiraceae bacterium]